MANKNKDTLSNLMTPESLSLFFARLEGLDNAEIQKAKELYLRNAITELASEQKQYKISWLVMGLHLLIPIFWPMLLGSQKQAKIELYEAKERIENALKVWRHDIGRSYLELKTKLDAIELK